MDDTLTSGSTEEDLSGSDDLCLVVAFHPSAEWIGHKVELRSGSLIFGRDHRESGLHLNLDRRMSRAHAEFVRVKDELVVEDLRSRNGTWVNNQRVRSQRLSDGDLVRIGSVAVMVRRMSARPSDTPDTPLIGAGVGHQALLRSIEDFAPRRSLVLLEGPPGVGKGLIARAIHDRSARKGPFVTFDCGSVAPGVMHSELFGHEAGAFSGAASRRRGLIEQARDGTLFLDEIGDASPELQSSLLRLLEEGEYRRVGSDKPVKADVRVVAATNRDLDGAVRNETFRFDLLTRIRRLWIRVPTLAERIEDVPLLATHIARRHRGPDAVLHRQLAFALMDHDWPGNVRELDAVVERAVVASPPGNVVRYTSGVLPDRLVERSIPPTTTPKKRAARPDPAELASMLAAHGGNVTHLAKELGVARHTVYRWVKEADIDLGSLR